MGRWASVTSIAFVFMWLEFSLVADVQADQNLSTVPVVALVFFGDSTVDAGNNNYLDTVVKSNFPPYGRDFDTKLATGRFTDGRLEGDFLATKLGLPLALPYLHPNATGQNLVHGINFASAASGYLDSTSAFLNVLPASKQLQMFDEYKVKLSSVVGPQMASSIISEALYIVSAGSNDYLANYLINPALQKKYSLPQFQTLLMTTQLEFVQADVLRVTLPQFHKEIKFVMPFIGIHPHFKWVPEFLFLQKLYEAGARKIGIFGLPALGCIPLQITVFGKKDQKNCVEDQNAIAEAYNKELQAAVPKWEASLPGSKLLYLDAYSLLLEVFNNPAKYGYVETRRACCGEGLFSTAELCNADSVGTCSDASNYVFFDSLHPTQSVYRRGAEASYEKIVSYFKFKRL